MDEGIIRVFQDNTAKPHPKIFGKRIYEFDIVDSVMDIAHQKARDGECEGAIILAKGQKKGRGRFERKWLSPVGKGLYFSVILKPDIKHCDTPKITLLAALSVTEAINTLFNTKTQIRWPNDILLNGNKVCGILTETNTKANKLHFLVVGIGVNINFKSTELPKEASSLQKELKKEIDPDILLSKILKTFEENYLTFLKKDFSYFIPKIKRLSATLGKRVKINTTKYIITGVVQDIDKDGALILRLDNGFMERILTGDCVHLR